MLAPLRRRPPVRPRFADHRSTRQAFAAAPALCEALEDRALLSSVTISAADNDAAGRQTVVLPDDATAVTVLADGAYSFLKIDADGVLSNVAVTLADGLDVTEQLWIESDDGGTGAVTLARDGGGTIAFGGELRFRGNGGGGAGPGDDLAALNLGSASLVLNGDATVGRITADDVFIEGKGSAAAEIGAVTVTGAGLADFTAEDDSVLTLASVDAAGGGDVRMRALERTRIVVGDVSAGDGADVELRTAEISTFTARDVSVGDGGTVRVAASEGGNFTARTISTAGDGGGVTFRGSFGTVVRVDAVNTGGDVGVAGIESAAVVLGDVVAGGTVAVGLGGFAATQIGSVTAENFAVDTAFGPVVVGPVDVSDNVAILADGDFRLRGTEGDDVMNMLNWEVIVAGTLIVESFGGDDFIRLGYARTGTFEVGSLEVFTGDGTDVVRTDRLTVEGRAGVLFEGTGTLAAWYGSAGSWFAIAGAGNTRATFALGAVVGDVTLRGGDGRDALVLTGQSVGGRVSADTGAGRDTVVLRNNSSAGSVTANSGADTDSLSLVDAVIAGDVRFDAGATADRVSVARTVIAGALRVNSGDGNDQVRIVDTRARRIDVRSEGDRDRVRVQTSRIEDRLFVDLGDDKDRLDLDARTVRTDVVRLRGGAGFDRLVDGPEEKSRGFERFVNRS